VATLYRSVVQSYQPSARIGSLFPVFLAMINHCIRLSLPQGDFSYDAVKRICQPKMSEYEVEDSYRISAIFGASNLLKKYQTDSKKKKVSAPYCHKPFLGASLGIWREGNDLVLPGKELVHLNPHTVSVLQQSGVKIKSATLTPRTCSVIYFKWVKPVLPSGTVAVDLNLDNITTLDSGGESTRYDLEELTVIHETYRRVKSRFRRPDVRIKGRLFRKYAAIEWNKKSAIMHEVSAEIVRHAFEKRQGIVLEDLRGIRDLYKRGSGSSSYYLSKMNAWPFFQILHRIAYKAEWLGLPVHVLNPEWSSEKCSGCGERMETSPVEPKDLICLGCGLVIDRDLNAAKNLLRRGQRSWPGGSAGEAMTASKAPERGPNAGANADHPAGDNG
jgi:putative transposase